MCLNQRTPGAGREGERVGAIPCSGRSSVIRSLICNVRSELKGRGEQRRVCPWYIEIVHQHTRRLYRPIYTAKHLMIAHSRARHSCVSITHVMDISTGYIAVFHLRQMTRYIYCDSARLIKLEGIR